MTRIPKAILPLIAAMLALVILGSAAQAQNPVRRGRALLTEFCGRCHAIGKHGDSPRQGAPPFRVLIRSFDIDQFPQPLERGISPNHPKMPTFKFSEDDTRAMRAYLRTLQK